MNAKLLDRLIQLTDEAMSALGRREPLSTVIEKAIRIARLRSDWENLWWLEMEQCSVDDELTEFEDLKKRLIGETAPHFTTNELQKLLERTVEGYFDARRITLLSDVKTGGKAGQKGTNGSSVRLLERAVDALDRVTKDLDVPANLHPVDLYFETEKARKGKLALSPLRAQNTTILDRISTRVHSFLSATERQLLLGQVSSDIFERNRQYVDQRLLQLAPEVAEKFAAAYQRLDTDEGSEALSQALTSCRRALKALADRLYPPPSEAVVGADGKPRMLTDDMFIARLWQYIHETLRGAAARTTLATLQDLGTRLDRLNDFSSKGVHATVSRGDAEQCVIQTYLVIGDILRLSDSSSQSRAFSSEDLRPEPLP